MRAVDWCAGLGGMTDGMLSAGFETWAVDIEGHEPFPSGARRVLHDIRTADPFLTVPKADWDHCSPPCQRFSLARAGRVADPPTEADLDILKAFLRLRDARLPRFWSVENVRGSLKWFRPLLGEPVLRHGPFYLWGNFPPFLVERSGLRKGIYGSKSPTTARLGKQTRRPAMEASRLPLELTRPLATAVAHGLAPCDGRCNILVGGHA